MENGKAVLEYTQEMDFEAFLKNRLVRDASERCLARISEAAVKLGSVAEELFPRHGWRDIRNFGNILRHEYEDVLDDVTWAIITRHLPPLIVDLETFLAEYPEDQETL
ncbi:HepT-like ribonuclease domain-containing protein [Neorhizobium petrolearium]|uniref:HepT-like ribonuclease domain-containing protein n=1 Tax=Neorhizobium petrolearium TaxID=515361 RepID=UPI003F5CCBA5